MASVVHFEIQASEPERLVSFYEALFGWRFRRWQDADYWLIDTGSGDDVGINGALLPRRGPRPEEGQPVNCFVCTVDVASCNDCVTQAMALSADVAVPRMAVPGVGWLAYLKDPDGNIFGIMERDESAA